MAEKTPAEKAAYARAWRAAHPDRIVVYRAKSLEQRAKRLATPEGKAKHLAYRRSYRARLRAARGPVAAKPDKEALKAARLRRLIERYRQDPITNMSRRMSSAVRASLKTNGKGPPNKFGVKWLKLVGYTTIELRAHIQRQFLPKMGWHNMSKWHIDHIVPLASFRFETADDPQFRAAWALTNLRPVWAVVNLRKNARREFLL